MVMRMVSLVVALVLMALLASSVQKRLHASHTSGPATPETLLREAGTMVEQTHQLTGVYDGVGLQGDSALRLVSSDASGFCLQLTWINSQLYHLRGPGGEPASGGC